MKYIVEQSDLIGDLKDVPIEIAQKLVEMQEEQGNFANIEVFQDDKTSDFLNDGIDWRKTIEGRVFWQNILIHENYSIFFEKFPIKLDDYPKLMWVSNHPDFINPVKRVVFAKKNGHYLAWVRASNFEEAERVLDTWFWKYAKDIVESPVIELTIGDIAKKFGVSSDNIKIKQ